MSKTIISVQGLGKSYRMAASSRAAAYRTLIDDISLLPQQVASMLNGHNPSPEAFWALKDLSFDVKQGEVIGIIGRNGAGKSTLLKILSRITPPTEGRAEINGRVGSLLEVGTGFHPELSGRENIFLNGAILGMTRTEIQRKFDEIVAFAEVEKFIDTPVKHYSSGMYVRLAFAVAAHLDSEVLLVDEVLAVGDAKFQRKCLGKMGEVTRTGKTILLVSHNFDAILTLSSKALLLEKGSGITYGPSNEVVERYVGLLNDVGGNYIVDRKLLEWRHPSGMPGVRSFNINEDVSIALEFVAREALTGVRFDFLITDPNGGIAVHSRWDYIHKDPVDLAAGRSFLARWMIKSPKLSPGDYYLIIYAYDVNGVILWVENIRILTILPEPYFGVCEFYGILKAPIIPEFSIVIE